MEEDLLKSRKGFEIEGRRQCRNYVEEVIKQIVMKSKHNEKPKRKQH
jgi:hypothetical protein